VNFIERARALLFTLSLRLYSALSVAPCSCKHLCTCVCVCVRIVSFTF